MGGRPGSRDGALVPGARTNRPPDGPSRSSSGTGGALGDPALEPGDPATTRSRLDPTHDRPGAQPAGRTRERTGRATAGVAAGLRSAGLPARSPGNCSYPPGRRDSVTSLGGRGDAPAAADGRGPVPGHGDGDHWWVPSGRTSCHRTRVRRASRSSTPRGRTFFLPHRILGSVLSADAAPNERLVSYDDYDLLAVGDPGRGRQPRLGGGARRRRRRGHTDTTTRRSSPAGHGRQWQPLRDCPRRPRDGWRRRLSWASDRPRNRWATRCGDLDPDADRARRSTRLYDAADSRIAVRAAAAGRQRVWCTTSTGYQRTGGAPRTGQRGSRSRRGRGP